MRKKKMIQPIFMLLCHGERIKIVLEKADEENFKIINFSIG
jgi:hypothetical protein